VDSARACLSSHSRIPAEEGATRRHDILMAEGRHSRVVTENRQVQTF
jgi:hypothetical protein